MLACVERLTAEGVLCGVQVRSGFLQDTTLEALIALCNAGNVRVWFNRDVARALQYQVGFHGGPNDIIKARAAGVRGPFSAPAHSAAELRDVQALGGVETVFISPVFAVPGKGIALRLDGLAALAALHVGEVVALGGITRANAQSVLAVPNVTGVAAIRRAWSAA
jgi:thiamine monophosphate synthase